MGKECGEEELGTADAYLLPDDKRLLLEYYKNNIIHHFLPISFLAAAILEYPENDVPIDVARGNYIFLVNIFSFEFLLGNDQGGGFDDARTYLEQSGVLKKAAGYESWKLDEITCKKLRPFSGLVESCLLSYLTVFKACIALKEKLQSGKSRLTDVRQWAEKMYAMGEIGRGESLSGGTYANALKFLEQEGMIASKETQREENGRQNSAILDEGRLEVAARELSRFLRI